ncbi:MAG TPA: penicillin-binding transpeptidase domain-containing protein [Sinomonas sp.]|nr:penicillin-binding transpeptidase domain-containing protein [Sinomonas sp.]
MRTASFVLSAVLLGAVLTSCDDGSKSAAEAAAKDLSSGLSSLDVSHAALIGTDPGAAQSQLKSIVAGLGDVKPSVTAGQATTSNGTTTVPFDFSWELSGREWKYTTTAEVAQSNGRWGVKWLPGLVAPGLQAGEVLELKTTAPPRGDILGANDAQLVTERPVKRVGIDKAKTPASQLDSSARALASLVGIDPAEYAKQVAASGPQAFVQAIVLRDVPGRTPTDEQIAAVPGAFALGGTLPLAPTREFARAVLGTVGDATAEQIQKSKGELNAGDQTGQGGLEAQYDDQLRGKDGVTVLAVNQNGASSQGGQASASPSPSSSAVQPRALFTAPAQAGTPLRTTLDPKLQQLADDTLASVGPASAIVAIRPSDGSVLAAASGPGSNGYNTSMLGQYAPGSIFKTVDSLALFRQGATPDLKVQCTPTLTADGKNFQNATGYPEDHLGTITLEDAYAHSCNTAFISQRDKVSQAQLESAATSLGLAIDAPQLGADAFMGSVPATAGTTEHAASMIGQGQILMSPLSAAVMAASVQKGGLVSPRLVLNAGEGVQATSATAPPSATTSATQSASASPAQAAAKPITPAEAAPLQQMMRAVVTSGHAGFLLSVPGAPVGAKTGTAEFGSDNPPKTHAWIIGVHGDLAVAVFVDEGGLGATISGPLLTNFLTKASQ